MAREGRVPHRAPCNARAGRWHADSTIVAVYKEIHGWYNSTMTKTLSLDNTTLFIGPPHPETITVVYRLDRSTGLVPPILKDILNNHDTTEMGINIDDAIYVVSEVDWKLDDEHVIHTVKLELCKD